MDAKVRQAVAAEAPPPGPEEEYKGFQRNDTGRFGLRLAGQEPAGNG